MERLLFIRRHWRSAALGCALIVVAAGTLVFAAWRPDLPPRSDLGTVSRLLWQREVARLDLVGTDLTVTTTAGQRLRVEDVSLDAFQSLRANEVAATDASLGIHIQSGPKTLQDAQVAAIAIGSNLLLLGAVLWILRALWRRRPPVSGQSGSG